MSIKSILMTRDHKTEGEADELIKMAQRELFERLIDPETNIWEIDSEICSDYFGLEPDYIDELF